MTRPPKLSLQHPIKPPRGAAIAGVIFSVLLIVGLGLARYAVPSNPNLPGIWLTDPGRRKAVRFALDLVPFAGIAFLWFIGVLRNRLGELDDQFFATVFLASGLLFVACMFVAAAVMGALIESLAAGNIDSETYYFGRHVGDALVNLFAMKMAGVFMISACTIGLRTAIFPRWVAFSGYACALVLLVVIANWRWITLVFPIWMMLISVQILLAEFQSRHNKPLKE
jgi:hypothetical protein